MSAYAEYQYYDENERAEELAELQARMAALEGAEPADDDDDAYDPAKDPYAAGWQEYYASKAEEEAEEDFDVIAAVEEYKAADRAGRAAIWAGLSAEEREMMAANNVTGPRQAPEDEEAFELVGPDDPDYAATMQMAQATVRMGLAYIRTDELDVSEELADRIVELADIAEMLPDGDPTRTEALQTAAAMIDNAIAEARAAVPFGASGIRTTEGGINAQGLYYSRQVDRNGRVRESVSSPESVAAAEAAYDADHGQRKGHRPWGMHPEAVTIEELAGYDYQTFKTFEKEHGDVVEKLLAAGSVALQLDH